MFAVDTQFTYSTTIHTHTQPIPAPVLLSPIPRISLHAAPHQTPSHRSHKLQSSSLRYHSAKIRQIWTSSLKQTTWSSVTCMLSQLRYAMYVCKLCICYASVVLLDNPISQDHLRKQTTFVVHGGGWKGTTYYYALDNLDDLTHWSTRDSRALYYLPRSLDCDP